MQINNPNDATALNIGMVHQHFKLVDVFTVLDNIILGAEDTKLGFLQKKEARRKVQALSEKYRLSRWIWTPRWRISPWVCSSEWRS